MLLSSFMMQGILLAQTASEKNADSSLELLQRHQSISSESYEIWNQIWPEFFESQIWTGLIIIGLTIAGFSFISAALQWLPDLTSQNFDGRRTFRMFAPIMAVTILLGNGGVFLGDLLLALRNIGTNLVNLPLRLQIFDLSLLEQIANMNNFFSFVAWLRQLTSRCDGAALLEYETCLRTTLTEAEILLDAQRTAGNVNETVIEKLLTVTDALLTVLTGSASPGPGSVTAGGDAPTSITSGATLAEFLNPASIITGAASDTGMADAAIERFLSIVQVAFVNGLEIVLLGAFALFPIVLALLLTSQGGQALTNWISGIAGLYATQLVYNVLTGFICMFLFMKDVTTMTSLDSGTFKFFVSFLAPLISLGLGFGQFSRGLNSALSTARFQVREPSDNLPPPGQAGRP